MKNPFFCIFPSSRPSYGRRYRLNLQAFCAALLLQALSWLTPAVSHATDVPDGFAKGVTGGGSAASVKPTTTDELKSALCAAYDKQGNCTDDSPRVIVLDRTFDFRGTVVLHGKATTTELGCMAHVCPRGGGQWALNGANQFCHAKAPLSVTYDNAGLQRLKVGSNKTLIGLGSHAGVQGMGLYIGGGVHNVIVRNLTLSDINPHVVWGGDALTIDNAKGVWIDHNTFVRIGRQMIVTGWGSASHVTISDNEFDGRTPYSSTCDGHHYWVWLFLGHHDTLTVARNYVHDTSGRAPHAGGMGNADVVAQLVNNVFVNLTYQGAIMSRTPSSYLLAEGNYFEKVSHPLFNDVQQPGVAFALFDPVSHSSDKACLSNLGRDCVTNLQTRSGDDYRPEDISVLQAFRYSRQYLVSPMLANVARIHVPRKAGAGHADLAHPYD
ncbi:pectate lyase [Rouxiella badensis]|uniref:pectate lyase family protein n=1 Tax=Yersiniaceae TaxID=1903411 RepID=UPI001D14B5F8|nr:MULTISPECIES: pectate lyase [Yersiniaceae]MCC3705136.1 pectate lyase [Rouxiella badensis]MCC3721036.1 pectate lyase [Rouxiella badensis]MCC3729515.1 pectate lyase [Rouxiella badensis]MCC3735753.1 pectate lyase [Rouxiella badensis]MCC3741183.1 pectate lyase [Rouxiella badensis]